MTTTRLGRPFLTVWAGQAISTTGSTVSAIGVAVWVYLQTGSALWLGALSALASLPYLITGPIVPLIDRFHRRTVMITADVVASCGTVIALALAAMGQLQVWHLATAGFLGGLGTSLQFPAFQAAIPELVSRDALDRANGLNQIGPAIGIVVGPALATPLIAWFGIGAVLVVDVATFVVGITCTALVRFGERTVGSSRSDGDDGTWRSAFRWLAGPGRSIRTLLIVTAVVNVFLSGFNIAIIGLATSLAGTARSGLVVTAAGVAMIVGSLAVGRLGIPRRRVRAMGGGLVAIAAGCAVAASRPEVWVLVAGVVAVLLPVPLVNAATATLYHERIPATYRGRIFGLRGIVGRGAEPAGAMLAGLMAATTAPLMVDGRVGARTIGTLIGTGSDRGFALVVLLIAVAVTIAGTILLRWTHLEGEPADDARDGGDAVTVGESPVDGGAARLSAV